MRARTTGPKRSASGVGLGRRPLLAGGYGLVAVERLVRWPLGLRSKLITATGTSDATADGKKRHRPARHHRCAGDAQRRHMTFDGGGRRRVAAQPDRPKADPDKRGYVR